MSRRIHKKVVGVPHKHFLKWSSYNAYDWWGQEGDKENGIKLYTELHPNDIMWRTLKIWQGLGLVHLINSPVKNDVSGIRCYHTQKRLAKHGKTLKHPIQVQLTDEGDKLARTTHAYWKL